MNYIRHLNGLFAKMNRDDRLTSCHISLYMSIFQLWNINRFKNPVPIDRRELMKLSRIGGRNTYARCMKDLDQWGYIHYSPTGNLHTGWKVSCISFDENFPGDEPTSKSEPNPTSGIKSDTRKNPDSGITTKTGNSPGSGLKVETGNTPSSGITTGTAEGLRFETGRKTGRKTGRWSETMENTDDAATPPNITNSINKKKKKKKKKNPPKILKIQKEKFSYGTNPLHVENDKDYAEPL